MQREMTFTFIFEKVVLRIPLTATKTSSNPTLRSDVHITMNSK